MRAPTLRKVTSARVAQSNSPESDLLPKVPHIVTGNDLDGENPFSVIVEAAEPGAALDAIAVMPQAEFDLLERADPPKARSGPRP